ncbi:helicase-related protein [Geminicoccaceae bacterium 1502E]|nr:helicase-related protein [Geminicoccaceae bacterium 1502E]
MYSDLASGRRVVAVLGPTNTGKTHHAVERMLAHRSGMMGFPLRLLAREVYDRIVALRGPQAVALRTGEEKIGAEDARYVVATVEAMPLHREVEFLAVDEIQLCADRERGHVFTDRLLHARGTEETMFLGSDTIRPILRRLVPRVEIITRPRFSVLRHSGQHKLHRLPRRSAIVAFSAADVYTLAEVVRRQKGGAAVVMGALSPRTRNAQVELYQSGEVDYLVATDAIGMGLNMDLAHVAFASLEKFDGRQQRRLIAPEIAQIAGRAGRHMADGTFGTTNAAGELDEQVVEAVETHSFRPLKALRWRNSALDFRSIDALVASLDAPPRADCLVRARNAIDDRSLALLAQRPEIRSRAAGAERVRLLWQVCQIPDFRKTLTDAHLHLLATVFRHLTGPAGVLPNDWVGAMIARLDQSDGDIDTLLGRLAHIRTWTYLSHRADWLVDPLHWQGRAREVEDRLSDALHERLTQRFIDKRTAALLRSLREKGDLSATVEEGGEVVVDGYGVGRLEGLSFTLAASELDADRRVLAAAARRVAAPELLARLKTFLKEPDDAFAFAEEGDVICWRGAPVARLAAGRALLVPRVTAQVGEELETRGQLLVEERLNRWLDAWLRARLEPLFALEALSADGTAGGAARGLAFRLLERLGSLRETEAAPLLPALDEVGRKRLARHGVRFGVLTLHLPRLLKPDAQEARARLWRLAHDLELALPQPGRTVLRGAELPPDAAAAEAMGFLRLGEVALRQDAAERLGAGLRARARGKASFELPLDLAAAAGLGRDELAGVLAALGFAGREEDGVVRFARSLRRRRPARPVAEARIAASPFAALAALKSQVP